MIKKKIVAALLISCAALSLSACGGENANNGAYSIDGESRRVRHIVVDATSASISFLPSVPSVRGSWWVEVTGGNIKLPYTAVVKNDTLFIEYDYSWFKRLLYGELFQNNTEVKIYLPEGEYGKLDVEMTSGELVIQDGYKFETVDLECTSGCIKFGSDVVEDLEAECTSGEIVLAGVTCGGTASVEATSGDIYVMDTVVADSLDVKCTSGKINLSGSSGGSISVAGTSGETDITRTRALGDFNIKMTSGEVTASYVYAETVFIKLTSGEVDAKSLVASKKMWLNITSGRVKFDACDATDMDIRLGSGSLKGTILTPKDIDELSVGSGSVVVPTATGDDGDCVVHVTSGKVALSLAR